MLSGIPAVQNLHEQLQDPSYAEDYDPATDSFSPTASLTISQERYTAALLTSGKVLIVGGLDKIRLKPWAIRSRGRNTRVNDGGFDMSVH
jgi:hypothetical protein